MCTPTCSRISQHLLCLESLSPPLVQLAFKTQGRSPALLISIGSVHSMQHVINLPFKICKVETKKQKSEEKNLMKDCILQEDRLQLDCFCCCIIVYFMFHPVQMVYWLH